MLSTDYLLQSHVFPVPGIFDVNFTVSNPVDYHMSQHSIYVQYGVKNVELTGPSSLVKTLTGDAILELQVRTTLLVVSLYLLVDVQTCTNMIEIKP